MFQIQAVQIDHIHQQLRRTTTMAATLPNQRLPVTIREARIQQLTNRTHANQFLKTKQFPSPFKTLLTLSSPATVVPAHIKAIAETNTTTAHPRLLRWSWTATTLMAAFQPMLKWLQTRTTATTRPHRSTTNFRHTQKSVEERTCKHDHFRYT